MNTEEYRVYNRDRQRRWRAIGDNRKNASRRQWERNKLSPKAALRLMVYNAHKRSAEVTITTEDLIELWEKQAGCCVVTGIKMTWSKGRITPTSMSIDRIDPRGGYVLGNIRIVCHAVNCFKQDMTDAQMVTMARAIVGRADAQ